MILSVHADVMYIDSAIPDLVSTLCATCSESSQVYIAHGRNRQAEESFLQCCKESFEVSVVGNDQLDNVYQTGDVDVLLLHKL